MSQVVVAAVVVVALIPLSTRPLAGPVVWAGTATVTAPNGLTVQPVINGGSGIYAYDGGAGGAGGFQLAGVGGGGGGGGAYGAAGGGGAGGIGTGIEAASGGGGGGGFSGGGGGGGVNTGQLIRVARAQALAEWAWAALEINLPLMDSMPIRSGRSQAVRAAAASAVVYRTAAWAALRPEAAVAARAISVAQAAPAA